MAEPCSSIDDQRSGLLLLASREMGKAWPRRMEKQAHGPAIDRGDRGQKERTKQQTKDWQSETVVNRGQSERTEKSRLGRRQVRHKTGTGQSRPVGERGHSTTDLQHACHG